MVASALLAVPLSAQSDRLGDASFLAIGPAVIFVALVGWITLVLTTSRRRHRYPDADDGLSHRGPVMGGVLQGSPSQRTRRDPAPSVTHREVMAHIEQRRAEENEQGRAEETERARADQEAVRADRPAGHRRRRFGFPRLR
ncbi:hypothetical protein GWI34_22905 [Actinomadura sp. DSM 109109]|nr:hypothetical protein [Actinomadura lepetitiana]